MIHPDILRRFADAVAPSGFDPKAFLPCYGMAECSLAISFSPLAQVRADRVDSERLASESQAVAVEDGGPKPVRSHRSLTAGPTARVRGEIRGEQGQQLPERRTGTIFSAARA
jgi:fatty-acyl-CoA synthase